MDEEEEEEEPTTPRLKMGSNDVNNTPKDIGSTHSMRYKGPQNSWYSQEIELRRLDQLWKL